MQWLWVRIPSSTPQANQWFNLLCARTTVWPEWPDCGFLIPFERWGRENLERIFARFDGGVLHLHGNGRHLLDAVTTVRGLKAIYMADDRGFEPAFEIIGEAKKRSGDLPLVVGTDYASFQQALERRSLTGGVFYQVSGVPDSDTANRCMDLVRTYQP